MMTKTVALQKCSVYSFDEVFAKIEELFRLVPPPDVKDKVVLLKPNILYPKKPELAVCTHPIVVGACVKAFRELGAAKVLVGESPAIANSTLAAKATGMFDQVIHNGGSWVDFHNSVVVPCENGKIVTQFEFAEQFLQADVVVSVAKLKSHQFMCFTGAMKNLFGLVIGLNKAQQHYRFSDRESFGNYITDLNIAAKASYGIMDAIVGMEGPGGPGSGDPVKLNFLAASDNLLALDWKCASLVGYNPYNIPNLESALNRKYWLNSPDEIQTIGVPEDLCRSTSFKIVKNPAATLQKMIPKPIAFIADKFFTKTPSFSEKKCIKCERCKQICPAHVIEMTGKNGCANLIDKSKCLHCFCCHEICPHSAIKLKRFV